MSNETSKEEKKKRIILIGRSTAGKTTLCQRINNEELHYYKTQTVQVINKNMIDTPAVGYFLYVFTGIYRIGCQFLVFQKEIQLSQFLPFFYRCCYFFFQL